MGGNGGGWVEYTGVILMRQVMDRPEGYNEA